MTADQKKRLLKAKVAVALQRELGRVPEEAEIKRVTLADAGDVSGHSGAALQTARAEADRAASHLLRRLMLVGYARVSTNEQTLALQQDALVQAGVERVFTDTQAARKRSGQGLQKRSPMSGPGIPWSLAA